MIDFSYLSVSLCCVTAVVKNCHDVIVCLHMLHCMIKPRLDLESAHGVSHFSVYNISLQLTEMEILMVYR